MNSDRRLRKKDRTRGALLEGALQLFSERGIYEPSIEEITARADLGKGTFYQYFPSREALIAELVRQGFCRLAEETGIRLKGLPAGADPLPVILDAHEAFFSNRPEYLLLFHQARGWMKMSRHHGPALREAFEGYVADLARFLSGGTSPTGGPLRREALVVAGFISGVLSFRRILELENPEQSLTEDLGILGRRGTQSALSEKGPRARKGR